MSYELKAIEGLRFLPIMGTVIKEVIEENEQRLGSMSERPDWDIFGLLETVPIVKGNVKLKRKLKNKPGAVGWASDTHC